MTIDFAKIGQETAETGADYTKPKTGGGGGDYTPPAEGPCHLRFVGYIETGVQEVSAGAGKPKKKEARVNYLFEVSGPKHPPREGEDGTKFPAAIVVIHEKHSLHEKANNIKLFTRLNYAGKAQHPAQLLGEAYKGRIVHRKYKKRDNSEGIAVELRTKDSGYTIEPPRYELTDQNGPTGEFALLTVAPALSPIKCFVWNSSTQLIEQWNSLFIDGTYEERKNEKGEVVAPAKSKNVWQDTIKRAFNFEGSPIHTLLLANGQKVDIPASTQDFDDDEAAADDGADTPATPAAQQADPLAGVA
jgi:hypothetical protein